MRAKLTIGIDLPIKALVWQDPRARLGSRTTIRRGWSPATGGDADLDRLATEMALGLAAFW